ncbi:phage tail assembly chaperone [Sphingomonas sp.]|uniref:phage tail assembly chaperone n=1 Tax=Sphingomonas sp. TaxID=28214 RepID=UPI0039C968F0
MARGPGRGTEGCHAIEEGIPLHHPPKWANGPPPLAGEDFGSAAIRLAGFCAVVLGWAPDQFWRATPAELRCVVDVLAPREEAPVTRSLLGELEKCCG